MATIIVSIIQCYIFFSFGKHIGEDRSIPLSKGIKWIVLGSLILAAVCWAYLGQPLSDDDGYITNMDSLEWSDSLSSEGKSLARLKVFARIFLCSIIPGLFGYVRGHEEVKDEYANENIQDNKQEH